MTDLEQKYQDFREAFREAALEGELYCKIEERPEWDSYNANVTFIIGNSDFEMAVADTYVCAYDRLLKNLFSAEDIVRLNETIMEKLNEKDPGIRMRIKELENELRELKMEIA